MLLCPSCPRRFSHVGVGLRQPVRRLRRQSQRLRSGRDLREPLRGLRVRLHELQRGVDARNAVRSNGRIHGTGRDFALNRSINQLVLFAKTTKNRENKREK